jgi:hypothetical protein
MITKGKHNQKLRSNATISSSVRDYGREPFFIKKADDSKKFLEEHGFPKAFLTRSGKA